MRSRIIGFFILVALGLVIEQCSSAKRDDAGVITKSGDVSAFEIQVGDCFKELPNLNETAQSLSTVSAVPCNEAHHWQAFNKSYSSLADYSEEGVSQEANTVCNSAAQNLVNNMSAIKYDAFSNAQVTLFYPTYKSWTLRGDRAIDCLIGNDTETYFTSVFE